MRTGLYRFFFSLSAALIVAIAAMGGCSSPAPAPQMAVCDTCEGWPDLREQDAGFSERDRCDNIKSDQEATGRDIRLELVCEPLALLCDSSRVVQCNDTGTGTMVVLVCDDGDPCTEDTCLNGKCLFEPKPGPCCDPPCGVGFMCIEGECVCVPDCFGKECGDDGCGGSCGECPEGTHCVPSGNCVCIPACEGKECGDDGCGGSCGECLPPTECLEGQCICVPACEGKQCGDDGCGGSCGECPDLHVCDAGTCKFNCPTCPKPGGCVLHPYGGHAYYFCDWEIPWNGANKACQYHSTHLASLTTPEENAFAASHLGGNNYWIGLYQKWYPWESEWLWVTQEPYDYKNWAAGQPDDGGVWKNEDCVELTVAGSWNDAQCGKKKRFICEFEPAQ